MRQVANTPERCVCYEELWTPTLVLTPLALSSDEKALYVSAWGDGIEVIDLRSGSVEAVRHPDNLCLAFIDGLYAVGEGLIAIQNGPILPRIVDLKLDEDGRQIVQMRVLERRNPSFDGLTTGVVVGKALYYIANPQMEKKKSLSKLDPLQIFAVRIAR